MAKEPTASSRSPKEYPVVVTPHAVVITLNEKQRKKAQKCLERSGKIKFTIKEISVTKLPQTLLQDGVLVD